MFDIRVFVSHVAAGQGGDAAFTGAGA